MAGLNLNIDRFDHFTDHLADRIQSCVGNDVPADAVKHIVKAAVDNHRNRKHDAPMDSTDLTILAGEVICAVVNKSGAKAEVLMRAQKAINKAIQDYCGGNHSARESK